MLNFTDPENDPTPMAFTACTRILKIAKRYLSLRGHRVDLRQETLLPVGGVRGQTIEVESGGGTSRAHETFVADFDVVVRDWGTVAGGCVPIQTETRYGRRDEAQTGSCGG